MRTILTLVIAATALIFGLPVGGWAAQETLCSGATIIVCDNFDDRSTGSALTTINTAGSSKQPAWEVSDTSMAVVNTQAFSGTQSLQWTYPAGSGGAGYFGLSGLTQRSEYYVRFYMKNESNWVWSGNGNKMLYMGNPVVGQQDNFIFDQAIFSGDTPNGRPQYCYPFPASDCLAPWMGPNVAGTVHWPLNQWVCVEMHLRNNSATGSTADGLFEVWIDGALRYSYPNINVSSQSTVLSAVKFSGYWNAVGTHPLMHRWVDNIVVATARIGCIGSQAPADTTAPGIPVIVTSASGGGQGNVSWAAVTDNIGVQGYEVLRCTGAACPPSTVISTLPSTTLFYTDTTLSPSTTYRYAVKSFDAAGNRSLISNIGSVTTTSTFKSTLASDTFTRANNTDLGASYDAGYTGQGPCQIVSNQVQPTTVNTRCWETYNATVPGGDQWAQRTISLLTGAQLADQCVLVRAANAATVTAYAGCALVNGSNTYEIREYTTGTPVVSNGSATYTVAAGDKIRMEAEGTALRLYRIRGTQETLVASATDASIASGKAGITNFVATSGTLSNNASDDFVIGDFGASTSGTVGIDATSISPDTKLQTNSWTHTVGSGTNRWLGVCLVSRGTVAGSTTVSSVTVNGTAITRCASCAGTRTAGGYTYNTDIWYQFAPNPGSNTILATWNGAPNEYSVGSAISLTGVDQTGTIDAQATANGSGTTASVGITTVADKAAILDCVVGQETLTVGAGQVEQTRRQVGVAQSTIDDQAMSLVQTKTPAGAETMDWSMSPTGNWVTSTLSLAPAVVTPVVPPTIATLTLSASGATLTAGATTPTRMRVAAGNNANTLSFADNVVWSTTYTKTWPDGYEFACFYPIDSAGVENTASGAYLCGSLIGIVTPLDTTPIVMTQVSPSGTLNQGTTSWTFSISLSKGGQCKWDTSNTTYALMANAMTTASLSASANTGNILSNGTTTHVYTQCEFLNSAGQSIVTTTALDIPISVAAGAPTDTTKPTTIANLAATALSQAQVLLVWPAATDANGVVSYNIYLCTTTTTCTPDTLAGSTGNVTQTVLNLAPLTTYCFDVRGVDPSNNEALASNAPCVTTTNIPDITPPTTIQNLRVVGGPFAASVILGWDQADGTPGSVTTTIEQCTGAGCSNFVAAYSNVATQQLQVGLTPGILYRFRVIATDAAGNRSLAYSNIVDVTTQTSGLDLPRGTLAFGDTRVSVTRDAAGARPVRP